MSLASKWKYVHSSVAGTAHALRGVPCQDATACEILTDARGMEVFIAAVSDGAGSAHRSEVGSRHACSLFISEMKAFFESNRTALDITRDFARKWIISFQSDIHLRSDAEGLRPRDFACTFVAAVVCDEAAAFLQVGDGSIVVRSHDEPDVDGYDWVFWADEGEYANQTTFLIEEAALERLTFQTVNHRIDEVALFTDGLQRLALHFQSRTTHAPFFQSMFAPLRDASIEGHVDALSSSLNVFLDSSSVNERTDDDKSLVLATRRVRTELSNEGISIKLG